MGHHETQSPVHLQPSHLHLLTRWRPGPERANPAPARWRSAPGRATGSRSRSRHGDRLQRDSRRSAQGWNLHRRNARPARVNDMAARQCSTPVLFSRGWVQGFASAPANTRPPPRPARSRSARSPTSPVTRTSRSAPLHPAPRRRSTTSATCSDPKPTAKARGPPRRRPRPPGGAAGGPSRAAQRPTRARAPTTASRPTTGREMSMSGVGCTGIRLDCGWCSRLLTAP